MGQPIREMGLVNYIKHKVREGQLDCFIASPFARSQYSLLWDNDESDKIFDFSFACARNADIGTPQDVITSGLGRSRQTKDKLVFINEADGSTRVVESGDGEKAWRKNSVKRLIYLRQKLGKKLGGIAA